MAFLSGHRGRRQTVTAILTVVILLLAMLGYAQFRRVRALTLTVSANYQKALYEAGELMSGVQLNLEKLLVSGSGAYMQTLLTEIGRQADGVQDNLSGLPPGDAALEGAVKFVNQVGDYARVLNDRLAGGGALTEADRTQIAELHKSAVSLNQQLADMIGRLERGEYAFTVDEAAIQSLPESGDEQVQPPVNYPVLLYDGPFSDARDTGTIKVGGAEVSADQAAEKLKLFIGPERVTSLQMTGESHILSDCYEFDAVTESGTLSASVTKAGGHVLYMLPDADITEPKLSVGECTDLGAEFLRARGYGETQISYWQQQDAILTVNYAAIQDGVILYPDLIKLQINMNNGLVVGVEAVNYLRNHTWRPLPAPAVTEEAAMGSLSEAMVIDRIRRCVIPIDAGEAQCWEVAARFQGGNRYLIYIDTQTGKEQSILQLVEENGGLAVQ
ncbi:MAG: germination protein YpeB [Eubacteriales bacterium]|nr:germination protein YpeB [Christensenellaceae bacterium]MEA5065445.1 germination protein YpeB [Eubacteriales bacterium]